MIQIINNNIVMFVTKVTKTSTIYGNAYFKIHR